jgi:hypothetical protein
MAASPTWLCENGAPRSRPPGQPLPSRQRPRTRYAPLPRNHRHRSHSGPLEWPLEARIRRDSKTRFLKIPRCRKFVSPVPITMPPIFRFTPSLPTPKMDFPLNRRWTVVTATAETPAVPTCADTKLGVDLFADVPVGRLNMCPNCPGRVRRRSVRAIHGAFVSRYDPTAHAWRSSTNRCQAGSFSSRM